MKKKIIYDNSKTWIFRNPQKELKAAYIPSNMDIDDNALLENLKTVPFTRVHYISKYGKANRTPRLTWAYGYINSELISYRNLDFNSEIMPDWLEQLSQYCRKISVQKWNFDPEYNSCIIGKYDDGNDHIGFHTDDESFLTHNFCANVTIGTPRDFQFKTFNEDGSKQTHEICLTNKSVFFFSGLEHALPKRAKVEKGSLRYSISFRNMANNIGIGNSFYYCRGLDGAIDNERKNTYSQKLKELQSNR